MTAAQSPLSDRLRAVIPDGEVSAAARRLIERDDVQQTSVESMRRLLAKWRAGDTTPTPEWQAILENEFGLPEGYLYPGDVTSIRQREFERRLSELERLSEWMRARLVELLAATDALAEAQRANSEFLRDNARLRGTLIAEFESRLASLEATRGAGGTAHRE